MSELELAVTKKAGEVEQISREEFEHRIREIAKCKRDIVYFAEHYARIVNLDKGLHVIKLYDIQKEFLRFLVDNNRVICCSGRQQGKSTIYCIYACWLTQFYPEKAVMILANKAATSIELVQKISDMWKYLPAWLKSGATTVNQGTIAFANKSSIRGFASSSDAARGFSANVVICDEFAFLQKNLADKLFTSMFPVISSSKNGKFIIVSTPNGTDNLYYEIWQKANSKEKSKNLDGWKAFTMWWWQVPGHDEAWKARQIEAIGATRFAQEFNNEFLVGSDTRKLIPDDILDRYRMKYSEMKSKGLTAGKKQRILSQTGDKVFEFTMFEAFRADRVYMASADISEGVGGDSSVLYVWDITELSNIRMVAMFSSDKTSLVEFAFIVSKILAVYGNPWLFAERNGVSAGMLDSLRITYGYQNIAAESKDNQPGIYCHITVKEKACIWAREMFTTDGFGFTLLDKELIEEFGTFVKKDNKGVHVVYAAPRPAHDDHVMTLVWGCYALSKDIVDKYFNVVEYRTSTLGQIYPKRLMPLEPYNKQTLDRISRDPIYIDFMEFRNDTAQKYAEAVQIEKTASMNDVFKYTQDDMYFGSGWDGGSWNAYPGRNNQQQQYMNPNNHMPVYFL